MKRKLKKIKKWILKKNQKNQYCLMSFFLNRAFKYDKRFKSTTQIRTNKFNKEIDMDSTFFTDFENNYEVINRLTKD
jgi:hypothetical protein